MQDPPKGGLKIFKAGHRRKICCFSWFLGDHKTNSDSEKGFQSELLSFIQTWFHERWLLFIIPSLWVYQISMLRVLMSIYGMFIFVNQYLNVSIWIIHHIDELQHHLSQIKKTLDHAKSSASLSVLPLLEGQQVFTDTPTNSILWFWMGLSATIPKTKKQHTFRTNKQQTIHGSWT